MVRAMPAPVLPLLASLLAVLQAPDAQAERWTPPAVSTPMFESHPAFDPWTNGLLFVRSDRTFSGWRILESACTARGWAQPKEPAFAGPGLEADPWFAPGGKVLWFISTRATGSRKSQDLDIWTVERDRAGRWAAPQRLPEPVNSPAAEWFPRLGPDGWLYFGSARPGGQGKTDIWRARKDAAGGWQAEPLGPSVNTADDEYEPLPLADGSLIVQAGSSYYLARKSGSGWSARERLGPALNANGSEIGALLSPSGRSLLFARDLGEASGELMVVRGGAETWPRACGGR